jgi:hypothetical protein
LLLLLQQYLSYIFAGLFTVAYAAAVPVTVSVEKYENGVLTVRWNQPAGTRGAIITYHVPDNNDRAVQADP